MWHPKRIKFQNLFAHVDSEYVFNQGVCTVIFGENRDDEDCENNGAGKSTMFEAISLALTGKSLRDIDKEVFINYDAEDCRIEFELNNDVIGKTLKIVRQFFRGGKSAKVEVWENDEQNKQITSVNEANQHIIDLIGISREDLLRYFVISQDNGYTFFKAGDVEKKEVLNRITSADMIQPAIDELNNRKKKIEDEVSEIEGDVSLAEEKLEFFKEQLIQQKTLSDDYEINNRKERIKEYETKIKETQTKIDSNNNRIKEIDTEVEKLNEKLSEVETLKAKRKKLKTKIETIEEENEELNDVIRKCKANVNSSVECPKCGHKFVRDGELGLNLKESKSMLKDAKKALEENEELLSKKKSKLSSIKTQLDALEEVDENKRELEREKSKLTTRNDDAQDDITAANKSIVKLQGEIKELEENSRSNKILKQLKEKIKTKEQEVKDLKKKLTESQDELDMVNYWVYYMGKNGFKTYLANRAVSIIEGITNAYLRKFHSKLSVEINGYKILKDGSVREKIDVRVLKGGVSSNVFMGYSGGQRGRISLAGVLGIQHLINMSTNGLGLDLCILDEAFHGVDARGQENIIRILENVGVTVLMVTQNVSPQFQSESRLTVVYEDGIAKYI